MSTEENKEVLFEEKKEDEEEDLTKETQGVSLDVDCLTFKIVSCVWPPLYKAFIQLYCFQKK